MAQSDNIGPVMLKSGEYVVRKEAVDKLGKGTLDMINNADRLGYMGGGLVPKGAHGHSSIDELLALNTLSTQRNTDMTRDSAMMNQGGQIKPIMDMRNRKNQYSLGVVDELARSRNYFDDLNNLVQSLSEEGNYPFGINQRIMLDKLQDSGKADVGDALKALDVISKRYYEGTADAMAVPKNYYDGGSVQYGTQTTEAPTTEDIYSMLGIMPDAENQQAFEAAYSYDPSREATTFDKYMSNVSDARQSGTQALGAAVKSSQELGGNFAGAGIRTSAVDTARSIADKGYSAVGRDAQRGMFEDIRNTRESFIQDALGELERLRSVGGTETYYGDNSSDYSNPFGPEGSPPTAPSGGTTPSGDESQQSQMAVGTIMKGTDGNHWQWDGTRWTGPVQYGGDAPPPGTGGEGTGSSSTGISGP